MRSVEQSNRLCTACARRHTHAGEGPIDFISSEAERRQLTEAAQPRLPAPCIATLFIDFLQILRTDTVVRQCIRSTDNEQRFV